MAYQRMIRSKSTKADYGSRQEDPENEFIGPRCLRESRGEVAVEGVAGYKDHDGGNEM